MDNKKQILAMKIAMIGQKGIPAVFGGIEQHVEGLGGILSKDGCRVAVYVRDWYTDKNLSKYRGADLIHIPTLKTKYLDAFIHSFLSSIHSGFQDYDIVHYHGLGPSFFSWIPRLFNKKVLVTIHRLDWQSEKWGWLARLFLRYCELFAINVPQKTVVVSKALKEYFISKYNKELIYIPNGTILPQARPFQILKRKYGLQGKDYIAFIGRLVPEKRIEWAIRAFKSPGLQSETAELKFVISGGLDGESGYINMLKREASGDKRIIFTDCIVGREKEELLSNALLFILPSYLEGLPIALLEAMSYGLCCLASDIAGNKELIEEGVDGFFFESSKFPALTKKLKWLLQNKSSLDPIGINAKKKIAREYSLEKTGKEIEKIYEGLLKEKPKT